MIGEQVGEMRGSEVGGMMGKAVEEIQKEELGVSSGLGETR